MNKIIFEIEKVKNSEIKNVINSRIKEFERLGKQDKKEIFKELCFCLITANFSASGGIKIQKKIGDGFLKFDEKTLSKRLSELGHRFPNIRAKYIVEARQHLKKIIELLKSNLDGLILREWIVKNIKGLGMKESSHFLRNIGYKKIAIIDFHILNLLVKHNLIEKPKNKSLSSKKYLEIEKILKEIGKKSELNLGELDLYLWYLETGKILK